MKKIIILLLLLIGAFSSYAQIQRQILGYTLGVSTRSVVVKGLENKGFDLEIISDAANKGPVFLPCKRWRFIWWLYLGRCTNWFC